MDPPRTSNHVAKVQESPVLPRRGRRSVYDYVLCKSWVVLYSSRKIAGLSRCPGGIVRLLVSCTAPPSIWHCRRLPNATLEISLLQFLIRSNGMKWSSSKDLKKTIRASSPISSELFHH